MDYICPANSNSVCYASSGNPVAQAYVTVAGQTTPSPVYVQPQITVTTQPDPQWLSNTLGPLGIFTIELSIALAVVAGARCALHHFVGSSKDIKKGK